MGQWISLGFKAAAVVLLWAWLSRAENRLTALSLGLIVGGRARQCHRPGSLRLGGGFRAFHVSGANWRFNWYVFNLADVAIVAGVGRPPV